MSVLDKICECNNYTSDDIHALTTETLNYNQLTNIQLGIVAGIIGDRIDTTSAQRMLEVFPDVITKIFGGLLDRIQKIFIYLFINPGSPPIEILINRHMNFAISLLPHCNNIIDLAEFDCITLMSKNIEYTAALAIQRGYHRSFYVHPNDLFDKTLYHNALPKMHPEIDTIDQMEVYELSKIHVREKINNIMIDIAIAMVTLELPVLQVIMIFNALFAKKTNTHRYGKLHKWSSSPLIIPSPHYQWEVCRLAQQYHIANR